MDMVDDETTIRKLPNLGANPSRCTTHTPGFRPQNGRILFKRLQLDGDCPVKVYKGRVPGGLCPKFSFPYYLVHHPAFFGIGHDHPQEGVSPDASVRLPPRGRRPQCGFNRELRYVDHAPCSNFVCWHVTLFLLSTSVLNVAV